MKIYILRTYIILYLLIFSLVEIKANEFIENIYQPDTLQLDTVYYIVDSMPEFPDNKSFHQYFIQNTSFDGCKEIKYRVQLSFIIEKDGSISNIRVNNKEKCEDLSCFEKRVFETINQMPKWKPGMHNKELRRVKIDMPLLLSPSR